MSPMKQTSDIPHIKMSPMKQTSDIPHIKMSPMKQTLDIPHQDVTYETLWHEMSRTEITLNRNTGMRGRVNFYVTPMSV
ncbi:hypothetical protein BgiBS90_028784 [Biomphalaria glabrata]|nr:hypothetical protein BgiBS90_028784 [Biomphalaria glabrata]